MPKHVKVQIWFRGLRNPASEGEFSPEEAVAAVIEASEARYDCGVVVVRGDSVEVLRKFFPVQGPNEDRKSYETRCYDFRLEVLEAFDMA